jgi:hypothetical protein
MVRQAHHLWPGQVRHLGGEEAAGAILARARKLILQGQDGQVQEVCAAQKEKVMISPLLGDGEKNLYIILLHIDFNLVNPKREWLERQKEKPLIFCYV